MPQLGLHRSFQHIFAKERNSKSKLGRLALKKMSKIIKKKKSYVEYFSLAALAMALNINLKNEFFIYLSMPFGVTANSVS